MRRCKGVWVTMPAEGAWLVGLPVLLLRRYRGLPWFVFFLMFSIPLAGQSSKMAPSSLAVKAALVIKFSKFVDWPAEAFSTGEGALSVGVVGDQAMGRQLAKLLEGEATSQRQYHLQVFDDISEVTPCHILYVGKATPEDLAQVAKRLGGYPTLTIGDAKQFTRNGGIIGFVLTDGRFRWEINQAVANSVHLHIEPNLLSYAVNVLK